MPHPPAHHPSAPPPAALPIVLASTGQSGPLRWALLPHLPRSPAEPLARDWLAAQLGVGSGRAPALRRDARGRPWLDPPHAAHDCNWSHSGEALLLAIGEGVRVGADLERLRPRPRAQALAERYFTAPEAHWVATHAAGDSVDRAFLRLWCAKEAVLKAHGHGLAFGLDRLRLEPRGDALRLVDCDRALGDPGQWTLHEFEPAPGYLAALAWRPR